MRKIAAIDIGTNSVRLMIASGEKEISEREKYVNICKLGQGVDKQGIISDEAMKKSVSAVKKFVDMANKSNADEIYIIGTAALRDSANRDEFVKLTKKETGVDVNIVDGKREATLGFLGAVGGIKKDGYVLVLDIGGGSTEFILGSKSSVMFSESVNIGALRLTERHISDKNLPISSYEKQLIRKDVINSTKKIIDRIKQYPLTDLIVIGGTATSYAAMLMELETYEPDKVQGFKMSLAQITELTDKLASMNLAERMNVKGLQKERADIIVTGGTILSTVISELYQNMAMVSDFDNLEGVFYFYS